MTIFLPNLHLQTFPPINEEKDITDLIYKIEFVSENTNHTSIRVSFLKNGQTISSESADIQDWSHKSSMYAASLAHIYRISSKNSTKAIKINVEENVCWIGTQLWDALNFANQFKQVWMDFIEAVKKGDNIRKYIVISGNRAFLSTPFESIQYAKQETAYLRTYNIPIFRSITGQNEKFSYVPMKKFPRTIVVLLGKDSNDKSTINYKEEIQMWFQLLQPNSEVDKEKIAELLSIGGAIENDSGLVVKVVPKGDLDHLKYTIQEQKEPYLFMYVGHGLYDGHENERDGDLIISKPPSISLNKEEKSHDLLLTTLKNSPVEGIFLNCCEAFRNYDNPSDQNDDLQSRAEVNYFNHLYNLDLIIGFRSKVGDVNAREISIKLIMSILNDQTTYEFISSLNKSKTLANSNLNQFLQHQLVRDQSSRVVILK